MKATISKETLDGGSLHPVVRCCVEVRISGMNFPRYRQCARVAVTVDEHGKPVCKQHSPASKAVRREKGDAARLRNLRLQMLRKMANMRAAKERKRMENPPEHEPKMVRAYPLELGVRNKATGETAWVDLRSVRDAARRLREVLQHY